MKPRKRRGKKRGMVAWLVTWDWNGDYARVEQPIVTFLNYCLAPERVREIVEPLYMNSKYSFSERLPWTKRKKDNPYPGVIERWMITCGHNPWLHARLVNDLKIEIDSNGKETVTWNERPRPKYPNLSAIR